VLVLAGGGLGRGLATVLVGLSRWHVEDVQNAAGGWLGGGGLGRVMGDVVAIDNVVVPISLTSLKCCALKSECAFPRTRLGGVLVLSKRKLTCVAIPGAK